MDRRKVEYIVIFAIPDYFKNPDRDIIDTIKKDILTPLFGADLDRALLHALSRAIAGYYEDKNFITYLGNRDCGKGIIDLLLRSSFVVNIMVLRQSLNTSCFFFFHPPPCDHKCN